MRKILTNALDEIERVVATTFDLAEKNQGFVEKRSNVFSTRRREISKKPNLFPTFQVSKISTSPPLFHEKMTKALGFFTFLPEKPHF
jgi:hypothetical protein